MKNRQLVYVPEINPDTFLLFFFRGARAYSLRDYTTYPEQPLRTDASSYKYTADEIIKLAKWRFDAETVAVSEIAYWHNQIERLNQRYLVAAPDKLVSFTERPDQQRPYPLRTTVSNDNYDGNTKQHHLSRVDQPSKLQTVERKNYILTLALAMILGVVLVTLFITTVYLLPIGFIKSHPYSYSIQATVSALILCSVCGVLQPKWRKYLFGVAGLAFLTVLIQLLGGPPQR